MTTASVLSQFGLFQDLPQQLLEEIAVISDEVEMKQGDFVFREGEKADKLHFLLHGSVALRVKLTSRPESLTVSFVSTPYQSFGWSGIVAPNHTPPAPSATKIQNCSLPLPNPLSNCWRNIPKQASR